MDMKETLERIWRDSKVRHPNHGVVWHDNPDRGGYKDNVLPLLMHKRGRMRAPRRKPVWNKTLDRHTAKMF